MKTKFSLLKLLDFKSRKVIHYSLIICILLIQLLIAGFFYNEFISRKNLTRIENQLKEINLLETLTVDSRKELLLAQNSFQKYAVTEDKQYLKPYFESLNEVGNNLEKISHYENKYPRLKNIAIAQKKDTSQVKKLKSLIDSTYQYSNHSNIKIDNVFPKLNKYNLNYSFDKYDIETKTYSDTVKKKGLFGRLGDAIAGKDVVRKENTVITIKQGKKPNSEIIKNDFDSIINVVNNHYTGQIKKIQVNVTNNQKNTGNFYKIFNNMILYSNELMNIYENAIKDSKANLQKEYEKQYSKNNRSRMYLLFGAIILMFIVSILIMILTRIAFIYERKLNKANKRIKENLNFKNRILGMLSHELRSPLKIIGLFINKKKKKTNDDSIKEYLKSISFTNNTLLIQANQILEYTKNQQVENKLIPVVFNLKNEINAILTSIKPYIETRNNEFIISENINPEITIYSDNTKINQLFMNILGNANKFTENGKIKVNTKTEPIDQNTISLITEITDTGAGISKKDLEKIFEPYYQGVLSDDVENIGAGLGLSLCKEMVELYSGKISVTSEINKGTTVTFALNLTLKK